MSGEPRAEKQPVQPRRVVADHQRAIALRDGRSRVPVADEGGADDQLEERDDSRHPYPHHPPEHRLASVTDHRGQDADDLGEDEERHHARPVREERADDEYKEAIALVSLGHEPHPDGRRNARRPKSLQNWLQD